MLSPDQIKTCKQVVQAHEDAAGGGCRDQADEKLSSSIAFERMLVRLDKSMPSSAAYWAGYALAAHVDEEKSQ